jgi:hypothetical protein
VAAACRGREGSGFCATASRWEQNACVPVEFANLDAIDLMDRGAYGRCVIRVAFGNPRATEAHARDVWTSRSNALLSRKAM